MGSRIEQFVPLQKIGTVISPKVTGDSLNINTIDEETTDSGVTIEGVLIKDSEMDIAQLGEVDKQSFTNLFQNGNFESWSAGASAVPDGWVESNATTNKDTSKNPPVDTNCAKITSNGEYCHLRTQLVDLERYKGRMLTLGVWAYAESTNTHTAAISIKDGVSETSETIPKDDTWHWLTVSRTIDASAGYVQTRFFSSYTATPDTDDVIYISGTIFVEGSICPAFSPKPLVDDGKSIEIDSTTNKVTHGGLTIIGQTVQTLTGAGAVDITSMITHIVTTGADALSLADGEEGQSKYIVMKTDANDGTLTPTNLGNGTSITFDDVGDSAQLLFTNGAWHFMGGTATLA